MAHEPGARTRLYLVRHAIAAERGPAWPDDTKRPLTRRGIARMRQAVGGLRALDVRLRVIATSPLVRAEQTARLLADGLDGEPEVVIVPALAPGYGPEAVAEALIALGDAESIAIVGHEPDLGAFAGWLLRATHAPAFRKGGVCCVDLHGPPGAGAAALVWMATPRMLRALS
jgi:phosphohistidine phosphatase